MTDSPRLMHFSYCTRQSPQ